jgi:hypothetical protein
MRSFLVETIELSAIVGIATALYLLIAFRIFRSWR